MRRLYTEWTALLFVLALATPIVTAAETWRLGEVTLTSPPEGSDRSVSGELRVNVQGSGGSAIELTAAVPFSKIGDAFIFKDKVAILADAGKADGVVIFDISTKREIDRIRCYQPRRVSDAWITYVEWYPAHSSSEPTDVLLGYDLALSPLDNRLEKSTVPPDAGDARSGATRVGFPLYPLSNALRKSYANSVPDRLQAEVLLGSPSILLPSGELVVPVDMGLDAGNYRTHLAVIDLSGGLSHPVVRRVELPTDKYPRRNDSPTMMAVTKMEAAADGTVRLYLEETEYGASSILVDIKH
jgi:hypothetical protein